MSNRPSVLQVGGTLYWVILTRNPDTSVLKDADSTPTVSVRKNGASTADSVTVTKRSATTGIYDCSYNPASEIEGDKFTFEESVTITGTTTAQATYQNNWNAVVIAVERGTDGANTITPPTVGAIADQVWDEAYADHTLAGSFGKLLNTIRKANLAIEGVVSNAITPTTLTFSSNVSATTSAYAHAVLLFVSGPLAGENSPIVSYTSTNGVFVLEEPLTAAPSNGDEFVVVAASHVHSVAEIQSGLATSSGVTSAFTEIKGAGWSSATDTLKEIADAAGAGHIMVTPVVAQVPVRVVGTNIETFIGDLSEITVGIFSGSDPVDLSGFGDLEVCVQSKTGTDLDFVEMADLTISGTDSNYVSWTPNGASVATEGRYKWSLRKTSNKQVIGYGAWIIVDAALEDVGS